MLTLYFTNSVFFAYLTYLGLEKKRRIFLEKRFWLLLIGLLLSVFLNQQFTYFGVPFFI